MFLNRALHRFRHLQILRLAIFACVVALPMVFAAENASAQPWAAKMFKTMEHDFGSVSRNAKADYEFVIENIYEEDVHIVSVRSSCGCTRPSITKNTLKTWEKGSILASFNTKAFIGHRSASITVVIDQPYYAEIQLLVKGHIRSDVVTDPGEVAFGEVELGSSKEIPVKISYAGRTDWKIVDVRGKTDHLTVRLDPFQQRGNMTSYLMHVALLDTATVGELREELIVVTNDANDNEFTLPIIGRIVAPLTVAPAMISLGDIATDSTKQQRFVVKANKPFKITEIVCDDERFEFTKPDESKTIHIVPFEFKSKAETGGFKKSILIKTDLGENFTAECVVYGQVKS